MKTQNKTTSQYDAPASVHSPKDSNWDTNKSLSRQSTKCPAKSMLPLFKQDFIFRSIQFKIQPQVKHAWIIPHKIRCVASDSPFSVGFSQVGTPKMVESSLANNHLKYTRQPRRSTNPTQFPLKSYSTWRLPETNSTRWSPSHLKSSRRRSTGRHRLLKSSPKLSNTRHQNQTNVY